MCAEALNEPQVDGGVPTIERGRRQEPSGPLLWLVDGEEHAFLPAGVEEPGHGSVDGSPGEDGRPTTLIWV